MKNKRDTEYGKQDSYGTEHRFGIVKDEDKVYLKGTT